MRRASPPSAPIRAVFMGTPALAIPALEALLDLCVMSGGEVVGVVCQPDRPAGRGMQLHAPPVKVRARELGLDVHQPTKMRDGLFSQWIRDRRADVAVVIAYGRILPRDVLEAPRLGCLNLHASLLPKLRGAAPIAWAIANRHARTGVCLMQMDEGLDTGPVLFASEIAIDDGDTTPTLSAKIGALAGDVLREAFVDTVEGRLSPRPQDHANATLAPILKKEDAAIDLEASGESIAAHVRAMQPWPGSTLMFPNGKTLKVLAAIPFDARTLVGEVEARPAPGEVLLADKHAIVVSCGPSTSTGARAFAIVEAQPEGKRAMGPGDLVNGRLVGRGDILRGRVVTAD